MYTKLPMGRLVCKGMLSHIMVESVLNTVFGVLG